MKEVLKKYIVENKKGSEKTVSDYEKEAMKLLNCIQDFLQCPHLDEEDKVLFKNMKTTVSKYCNIEEKPEDIEEEVNVSKDTYLKSDEREVEKMVDNSGSESITITENDGGNKRFNLKMTANNLWAADENQAREKMESVEDLLKEDIGLVIHEINEINKKAPILETYTKEEMMAFIQAKKKGYVFEGIVNKEDLLNE